MIGRHLPQKIIDTEDYEDFRGLNFKIVNLPIGITTKLETDEPTFIIQSTGDLVLTARAPTIIEGCTGRMDIDAYAPMLIKASTNELKAYLRENTAIEESTGDLNIVAAPYLEARISATTRDLNGQRMAWQDRRIRSLESIRGYVLIKGCTGNINFCYDDKYGLYIPRKGFRGFIGGLTRRLKGIHKGIKNKSSLSLNLTSNS